MILSILHRITGVAMSAGLVLLVIGLVQAAAGPEQYQLFRSAMSSLAGQGLLAAFSFAFFLHLGNGIRHLVWDTGRGFGKRDARVSAWVVIAFAVVMTTLLWTVAA